MFGFLLYIGAIVILVIIAIMLTRHVMGLEETPNEQWPMSAIAAIVAFAILVVVFVLAGNSSLLPRDPVTANVPTDTIQRLGAALVDTGQYTIPFLLAAVFLTGAMIGAIVIAREDN